VLNQRRRAAALADLYELAEPGYRWTLYSSSAVGQRRRPSSTTGVQMMELGIQVQRPRWIFTQSNWGEN